MVERGNRHIGEALRALLIGRERSDWDLVLTPIMQGVRSTPHTVTGETACYLNLGREVKLPDQLYLPESTACPVIASEYAQALQDRLYEAHTALNKQQYNLRLDGMDEPNLFVEGDYVWMKNFQRKRGESAKLLPKLTGPWRVMEALRYHTYRLERRGQETTQSEGRLRLHVQSPVDTRGPDALNDRQSRSQPWNPTTVRPAITTTTPPQSGQQYYPDSLPKCDVTDAPRPPQPSTHTDTGSVTANAGDKSEEDEDSADHRVPEVDQQEQTPRITTPIIKSSQKETATEPTSDTADGSNLPPRRSTRHHRPVDRYGAFLSH